MTKEKYCYRILKTYGLIVDFESKPERERVPGEIEGETYGRWKDRVLGESVTNIVLYAPTEPANNTRISTLQNKAGAEHLEKIFDAFGRAKEKQKAIAINKAVSETEENYTYFPVTVLKKLIEEQEKEGVLVKSLEGHLKDFLESSSPNIETEELIRGLLKDYNNAVSLFRKLNKKHEALIKEHNLLLNDNNKLGS